MFKLITEICISGSDGKGFYNRLVESGKLKNVVIQQSDSYAQLDPETQVIVCTGNENDIRTVLATWFPDLVESGEWEEMKSLSKQYK